MESRIKYVAIQESVLLGVAAICGAVLSTSTRLELE